MTPPAESGSQGVPHPGKAGLLFYAACAAILLCAAYVRFASLGGAPLHFDESTAARIVGYWLDGGDHAFNPVHFHGPLLGELGALSARLNGESSWHTLDILPLRCLPALAGLGVVALCLSAAPLSGRGPALCSAAFVALSPFVVHCNRLFIHESLLALFLAGALLLLAADTGSSRLWRPAAIGICLGLAAATRETFLVTIFSWAIAAFFLRPRISPKWSFGRMAIAGGVFLLVVCLVYSDFGMNPRGIPDFISTYWRYETTAGHEKPALYYARLFLSPSHHGRLWWWQGGVVLLGVAAIFMGRSREKNAARFCFFSGLLQAAVYSVIAYKTPWLMLVPWLHFLVAAGFGAAALLGTRPAVRVPSAALLGGLLAFQGLQAWRVAFRYPSDARNPFAYVPTSPGVGEWTGRAVRWLRDSGDAGGTVAVIGPRYWPLPWYLRGLPEVGYWPSPPRDMARYPLVIAMPDVSLAVGELLATTHTAVPEGLRGDTPVLVFFRNDIWQKNTGSQKP